MQTSVLTCQCVTDQTEEEIAAPGDKACVDDGTSERLDEMVDDGGLLASAHHGHLLLLRRLDAVSSCPEVPSTWWRSIVRCARHGRGCRRVRRTVSLGWRVSARWRVSLWRLRVCCLLGRWCRRVLRRRRLRRWKLLLLLAAVAMHLIVQLVLGLHDFLSCSGSN